MPTRGLAVLRILGYCAINSKSCVISDFLLSLQNIDSYSWELAGSDVDQILKVNEKLRKQLGGERPR